MSKLFSPLQIKNLTLRNRVVVSPMCQYAAVDGTGDDWLIAHLGSFAVSGPGLVLTEATHVSAVGRITPKCLGLYSDDNERILARVVKFFRERGGSPIGVQLAQMRDAKRPPRRRGKGASHWRPSRAAGRPSGRRRSASATGRRPRRSTRPGSRP